MAKTPVDYGNVKAGITTEVLLAAALRSCGNAASIKRRVQITSSTNCSCGVLRMPMFAWGQRRIKTPAWRRENGILIRLTTTTMAFRNSRGLGGEDAQHSIHQRQSVVVAARVVSTRNPELGAQYRIHQRQSIASPPGSFQCGTPNCFSLFSGCFTLDPMSFSWDNRALNPNPCRLL